MDATFPDATFPGGDLLDELSIYLRKVMGRPEAQQLTPFLTSLFKAIESSPKAVLVFTLAVGGHYPGPGDTVPPGLKDGFNLQCSQNPLLNFYTSICDSNGLCITNGYLHPYVGQAIISGSKTIPQMLASESSLMKQYSASWSQNGYPKDTCKKLWQPGSWMFVGKGASKVACLTVNWGIGWVSYMDLHADVCSTTTLYDGTP
jgi:hypothetical protein